MAFPTKTAEWVFPGHPDKLCDAIADAIVFDAIKQDARALVGVEVAVHMHHVILTGRVAGEGADQIDFVALVKGVYERAGYGADWGPSPDALAIQNLICIGPLLEGEAELREVSDDQAICVGFAIDIPETNYLPLEQYLVQQLASELAQLRTLHPELGLGPDGKVIIALEELDRQWVLKSVSCSLQQKADADQIALQRVVREHVLALCTRFSKNLKGFQVSADCRIHVNGAGAFELGGPEGDNGLSGKKLVVDAYGPSVPIGGGAWSGKDFFKADRAGGLHARRLAKTLVRFGLAKEATVTLGWTPGERTPYVLGIKTNFGQLSANHPLIEAMDLSLLKSGLSFSKTVLNVATEGHFIGVSRPWEDQPSL